VIDETRKFRVGDFVILNEVEQPCGKLIVVVISDDGEQYECQYLNADPMLDPYNTPPMKNRLSVATKVEDFGVVIRAGRLVKYRARSKLAEMLWPF